MGDKPTARDIEAKMQPDKHPDDVTTQRLAVPETIISAFTGELEFMVVKRPETGNMPLFRMVAAVPAGAIVVDWPAGFTGAVIENMQLAWDEWTKTPEGAEAKRRAEAALKGLTLPAGLVVPEGTDVTRASDDDPVIVGDERTAQDVVGEMSDVELASTERIVREHLADRAQEG